MDGPLFHMNEESGEMTRIIMKFLEGKQLDFLDLNILRAYIHQWVAAMPVKPPTYQNILMMDQAQIMTFLLDELLPRGIDPF